MVLFFFVLPFGNSIDLDILSLRQLQETVNFSLVQKVSYTNHRVNHYLSNEPVVETLRLTFVYMKHKVVKYLIIED